MDEPVKLEWHQFAKLTEARSRFAKTACIYVQTDARGCPVRVGKASEGLEARFRGGTGYAIDAAMHDSSNLVFVAEVDKKLCEVIEGELIWQGRKCLTYNNQGKITPPFRRTRLLHSGDHQPTWNEFDTEEEPGRTTRACRTSHCSEPGVALLASADDRVRSPKGKEVMGVERPVPPSVQSREVLV